MMLGSHELRGKNMTKPNPYDALPQSERFKRAARELGCDNSEERFVETVGKLTRAGPQHKPTRAKAGKTK